jgi:hypothetical protein
LSVIIEYRQNWFAPMDVEEIKLGKEKDEGRVHNDNDRSRCTIFVEKTSSFCLYAVHSVLNGDLLHTRLKTALLGFGPRQGTGGRTPRAWSRSSV